MPGLAWIILNAALVVVCIGGTVAVRRRPAPKPVQLEAEAPRVEEGRKTALADAKAPERGLPADAALDELWQNTLFLPERAEREAGTDGMTPEEAARAAQLAAQKIEFELIGIAQMALPDKESEPVAVLRNKMAGRGSAGRPMPGGPSRNMPNRPVAGVPASASATAPVKQIFRVGEKINETGYTVKSIDAADRVVEVVRGSEVVKLTINFASSEANQRRNIVAMEAVRKRNEEAAAQARQAAAAQNATNNAAPAASGAAVPTRPGVPGTAVTQGAFGGTNARPGTPGATTSTRPGTPGAAAAGAAAATPPSPPGANGPVTPPVTTGGATGMSTSGTGNSQAERAERVRRAIEARQRAAQQR